MQAFTVELTGGRNERIAADAYQQEGALTTVFTIDVGRGIAVAVMIHRFPVLMANAPLEFGDGVAEMNVSGEDDPTDHASNPGGEISCRSERSGQVTRCRAASTVMVHDWPTGRVAAGVVSTQTVVPSGLRTR